MSEEHKALEDRQLSIMNNDIINLEANECDINKETITTQQNNDFNWAISSKEKKKLQKKHRPIRKQRKQF